MRRNLVYYVYPVRGSVWEWNLAQISRFMPQFSGKRVVVVAQDEKTEDASRVCAALGAAAEVMAVPNDRLLWETRWFLEALDRVASDREDECTFYAHAKGVTKAPTDEVKSWAAAMYRLNLGRIDLVDRLMANWRAVGAFRVPIPNGAEGERWYYSGTFFWLRHSPLFSGNWRTIAPHTHGVELYPGRHVPIEDSYDLTSGHPHRPYSETITPEMCDEWLARAARSEGLGPPP